MTLFPMDDARRRRIEQYQEEQQLPARLEAARQRKRLCMDRPGPARDQAVVTRMQAVENADETGMVKVFIFAQGRCVAVHLEDAVRLAVQGRASIERWPQNETEQFQNVATRNRSRISRPPSG